MFEKHPFQGFLLGAGPLTDATPTLPIVADDVGEAWPREADMCSEPASETVAHIIHPVAV